MASTEDFFTDNVTVFVTEGVLATTPSANTITLQVRGALIMLPFVVVVIAANLLTIAAFFVEKRLRIFYNYFVINMAIADCLVGFTAMGSAMVQFLFGFRWLFGNVSCILLMTISHMSLHVSILMVLVICIDRWYAVAHPLKHLRTRRRSVAVKVNISVWFLAFVIWGPFIGVWAFLDPVSRMAEACSPVYLRFALGTFAAVLMFYWLPVSAIIILYIFLYRKIKSSGGKQVMRKFDSKGNQDTDSKSHSHVVTSSSSSDDTTRSSLATISHHPSSTTIRDGHQPVLTGESAITEVDKGGDASKKSRLNCDPSNHNCQKDDDRSGSKPFAPNNDSGRSAQKAQRTLSLLVLALVLTWTPYACIVLALMYCSTVVRAVRCFSPNISVLTVWITWSNSLLNPIMYAAAQPIFRKTIFRIITAPCRIW
ncbi:Muscarinic acetylcholine receptor M1 [Holothuria leucospilota]|uniref:Muscarinic acetylcholine receptor M1 n=1 Tax=Holothuria leucospilota TaxID=206669 RepID=A0A9Q1CK60_HOLLE|nr:Muscarinic acetylcholine receptor M1 [Holothuria leucospilota]